MSKSLSTYVQVFEMMPEMIFILGSDNRILNHNKAASKITGYDTAQLSSFTVERLIPEEHRSQLMKMIQSNAEQRHCETQIVRSDKRRIDIAVDLKVLNSSDSSYQVLIAKDITDEKKKELDLLRYSNVIEHTINPIQITDAHGIMVYVNPAFEKQSGYSRKELIGKNPNVLSSGKHPKGFWRKVWETILAGKVWVGQVENKRKDGSPFHTELVISPIVGPSGEVVGFLGAHRDITEQKLLEGQLVRSQKMEAIGTLAAGIAHEVGNPLTSISSLAQVIQRTVHDPFAKEKLELIKNEVTRISGIIRDLVDFSRPSLQVAKPTDVNQVVQDALNIVRYGKKVKNVNFETDLAENLPTLHLVPDQIVQVFINILMNAVDALDGKPGTIGLQSAVNGKHIAVRISDSGEGIPQKEIEKIFEPFFTTKEVGKGTGLGLWVSYGIVKNFSGEIMVETSSGKGSTFTVLLPLKGV